MDSNFSRACGRAEELMGFLYGESNERDANAFRDHLQQCAVCNAELSSFADIRKSLIAWRNESFSSLPSPAGININAQPRSAVAAIRKFSNLSPTWMRAAVGFASLLFCVFAVLAVFGLRQSNDPVIVNVEKPPSADQIERLVKQRVEDEVNRLKAQSETVATRNRPQLVKETNGQHAGRATVRLQNNARRPLTRVEREQLAADLRLISSAEDNGPNLLSDSLNQ